MLRHLDCAWECAWEICGGRQVAGFCIGVTTWQRVCREFAELGLDDATLPDTASRGGFPW